MSQATNTAAPSKVALVTGAGSGIGKGCATALLNDGWSVVFTGRRIETLHAAIAAAGPDAAARAVAIACDVTDDASVAALFEEVRQRFGRLDLLFNNAGVSLPSKMPDEVGAAAWRNAVDTNLSGAFYCLAEAFRLMRSQSPQGGRINGGMRNPEDANPGLANPQPRPGQLDPVDYVERTRRIHQNDQENLLPFLAIGWLYVMTQPAPAVAQALFYGYVLSRLLHFAAYLGARPHEWRAALWTAGSLVMIFMAVATLWAGLRA